MAVPKSAEALFVENLPYIDRFAAMSARQNGLHGDDALDFASWIKMRFVENDYAAIRAFRGDATLTTYLAMVVANLARDFRVQRWGRWRPSAAARRQGAVAVRLETLVHRDGCSLSQAGEMLRTSGITVLSDRQLAAILAELPARAPLRPREVGDEPLGILAAESSAESDVNARSASDNRELAESALLAALSSLSAEDSVVLRLHYWDGLGVAEISRALHLEQKPLYRRIQHLLSALRERLIASGIGRDHVHALLEGLG